MLVARNRLIDKGEVDEVVKEEEVVLPTFSPCRITDAIWRGSQRRQEVNIAGSGISPLQLGKVSLLPESGIRNVEHCDFTMTTVLYLFRRESVAFTVDDSNVGKGKQM